MNDNLKLYKAIPIFTKDIPIKVRPFSDSLFLQRKTSLLWKR